MSEKLPPDKKLRTTAVTFSNTDKKELVEYVDLAKISFAEYIRRLAEQDAPRRAKHLAKIKAGLDKSKLPE